VWPHVHKEWPIQFKNLNPTISNDVAFVCNWFKSELGHEEYDYYCVYYHPPTEKTRIWERFHWGANWPTIRASCCKDDLVAFVSLQPLTGDDQCWMAPLESLGVSQVGQLDDYIAVRLLMVDPDRWHKPNSPSKHIGSMLLRRAITAIQVRRHKKAVAVIPVGLKAAIRLCNSEGGYRLSNASDQLHAYYIF
jgi:hypothetical protein